MNRRTDWQRAGLATVPHIAEESAVLGALPGNAHIVAVGVLRWMVNARDVFVFAGCWVV